MAPQPNPRRIRLGVIVPSSNTVLELLTQQMVAGLPHVSVHFARFRVTKIELSDESTSQFTLEPMLEAARLLADAKVDIIGWSGTSASWLGFSSDETLCQKIKDTTGIPATSSVLAMRDILRSTHASQPQIGIVTPYLPEVNAAICKNFTAEALPISDDRSRCAGLSTNFDFANVQETELDEMMGRVVNNGAQIVLIVCTNLAAAKRTRAWEKKYQITVLDSVATVVYSMLQQLGIPSRELADEWGSIFS